MTKTIQIWLKDITPGDTFGIWGYKMEVIEVKHWVVTLSVEELTQDDSTTNK